MRESIKNVVQRRFCVPRSGVQASLHRVITFGLVWLTWQNSVVAEGIGSTFPTPFNTENPSHILTPPAEALAKIKAPPGFHVSVFASEPDVQNPIAMTFDERGRLWVAENYTYAEKGVGWEMRLRDRVVVFEDTKHTGHFDKRTVFWDGAQKLTSVEVGFGGVWLLCAPKLLFIPDRNGDLVPDGPPETVLDGWNDFEVGHNIVNGLKWGPDGWLYGRHGIQANSYVGKPGAPASERTKLSCCIWRYHPTRHVFEVVCQGTTNPWGMDWNDVGQAFFINTVIGHLWHVIPGAHYKRMYGEDFDPHVYELIDQHADHYHWDHSMSWTESRPKGKSADLGGGHAHAGLMIYQGDNWPEQYRNTLFTINLHGLRLNNDVLERSGSGYVGKHTNDFLFFNDAWFRGIDLMTGPDGGVYIADWCDMGECHEEDGVHRTSGRIYKVFYGVPHAPPAFDLGKDADEELAQLQLSDNVWYARQARRLLQERAAAGKDLSAVHASLLKIFNEQTDIPKKLRAMWALATSGGAPASWLMKELDDKDENVRVWAIRFLTDEGAPDQEARKKFVWMAAHDKSGLVRLALASALQRIPAAERGVLARALIAHDEDTSDHNLPLMLWYGIEPMDNADPVGFARLEWQTKISLLRTFISRRVTEDIERRPEVVNDLLRTVARKAPVEQQFDVLEGMCQALRGWRKAPKPASWVDSARLFLANDDARLHDRVTELGAVFGDGRALDELRRVVMDDTTAPEQRRISLQFLIENRPTNLLSIILPLLSDRIMAKTAVQGLATFKDPGLADQLIAEYQHFRPDVRPDVIATLTSRASFAKALLNAVADKKIERHDITAFDARQIHNLGDPKLDEELVKVWGEFHTSSEEKERQMAAWEAKLTPERLKAANLQHGHQVFVKTCAVCHRLYGEGAFIGPDLTGSGRTDLRYLLENVVDPSAVVAADYKMCVVETKDDRVLSGIIGGQNERTVTMQTANTKVILQRDEVQSITPSALSMMPEGLLDSLTPDEARDLVAYLMTPSRP